MPPNLSKSGAPLTLNCAKIPVPVFIPPPASASSPTVDPTTGRKISPLTAAALCVKPRGQMTPQQIASVDALKIQSVEFTIMRQLAMRFRGLLIGSSISALGRLAVSLPLQIEADELFLLFRNSQNLARFFC